MEWPYSCCTQSRNYSHTGSFVSPQSRLLVPLTLCVLSASCTLLFQYEGSTVITWASSQLTLLSLSHARVAIPFFLSSLLTAALCSTSLLFKFLFVSPTVTFSQSRWETLYTTLFFKRSGLGVFTCVSFSRSAWCNIKAACICSDTPWQYGRYRIF